MEPFDRDPRPTSTGAPRAPGDAQHVIDVAATPPPRAGAGWQWHFYRPFVALALDHDVPLIAGNVSSHEAATIVRSGYAAVFDAATLHELGLDRPVDPAWQRAQEREIDAGHCGALPAPMWSRMRGRSSPRRGQARALAEHAARGECSAATAR